MNDDRLITTAELCAQLGGIPVKTVRNKMSDGSWPIEPVRIGRSVRWRQSDATQIVCGNIRVPASGGRQ